MSNRKRHNIVIFYRGITSTMLEYYTKLVRHFIVCVFYHQDIYGRPTQENTLTYRLVLSVLSVIHVNNQCQ